MTKKLNSDETPKVVKAVRVMIYLGSISLWVFQMPNGEYRLSKAQILESIGEKKYWLSRLPSKAPKALKELQDRGFTGCLIKAVVKLERGSTRADTLSIADAMRVSARFSRKGNVIASDILEAAGIEAIERRADKAFGVERTEEEYNQRFAVRMDLKKDKFQKFSSAIAAWERKRGIYKTKEGARWFKAAHDQMNLQLQDLRSRQIKEANNLPSWALIRDHFEVPVLVDYSSISQLSANFLKHGSKDPVEAVNMACDCYLPDNYTASPANVVESIDKVRQKLKRMKRKAC
jgi:hypothetical protein